jgi:hypothetical protein
MDKQLLEQALEAIENELSIDWSADTDDIEKAAEKLCDVAAAIRARLKQPAPIKWSDYEPDGVHHNKPAQPEERNFCPRCGKRTRDLTHIHTCTPPQENT